MGLNKMVILRQIFILIKIFKLIKNWQELRFLILQKKKKDLKIILRNNVVFYTNNQILDIIAIIENFGNVNQHDYFKHVNLMEKPCIIDIGAHIGTFSVYSGKRFPNAQIFSYEPDEKNYEKLLKNLQINNILNVTTYNNAIGKSKKKSLLYPMNNNGFGSVGSTLLNNGLKGIEISCLSLKDILINNDIQNCDFLKMDCEGSEFEIILNSDQETLKKIKSITMEYHEINTHNKEELKDFLLHQGYDVIVIPNENNSKFGLIYSNRTNK
jgi:FkbM family methyltransferase